MAASFEVLDQVHHMILGTEVQHRVRLMTHFPQDFGLLSCTDV